MADRMRQDAVIRTLEIVGEAVKRLSVDIRDRRPEIPWKQIAGMRDRLMHDYFGIDMSGTSCEEAVAMDPRDDRLSRSDGRRMEFEPDLRTERRCSGGPPDVSGRRRRSPDVLFFSEDRSAEQDTERRMAAIQVQS